MEKIRILNIDIHNWKFDDFIAQLDEGVVITPNVDHLILLQKDREFYENYSNSEHIVCDSRVVYFLSKFLHPGRGIADQIAGSDLFPAYCQYHKDDPGSVRILLLGGTQASIQITRDVINQRAGNELVVAAHSPPFGFENSGEELERIKKIIRESGANILAIGVGSPKQEKWIFRHRDELVGIKLFFCVGATMNFEAGVETRAPRWMTRAGLEWLYRITQEPGRMIRRYLIDDLPIFWLITKQKLGFYKDPWL
ncbi:MAG: WecB/TagA/CpsF family glycosyltransferase [Myxococcota bacterium]|nr:WecB/TagA/CpsF family glycosyltransferase [Myxococcota bacterium]